MVFDKQALKEVEEMDWSDLVAWIDSCDEDKLAQAYLNEAKKRAYWQVTARMYRDELSKY